MFWSAYVISSSPELGGISIRDFYENLITTGKLRVVEEVEVIGHGFSLGHCNGCGKQTLKAHTYCPGCGNKIKR